MLVLQGTPHLGHSSKRGHPTTHTTYTTHTHITHTQHPHTPGPAVSPTPMGTGRVSCPPWPQVEAVQTEPPSSAPGLVFP